MMKTPTRIARFGAILGIATLAITGCSGGSGDSHKDGKDAAMAADSVEIQDAWVKAADKGDMTAAFGMLENKSDSKVNITAVKSDASPEIQLHETVVDKKTGDSKMQEVKGGFKIPAKGKLHLEPGGDHFMLMELPKAIKAGEDVKFTIVFSDKSEKDFTAVAKDFAGAKEKYGDDDMKDDMKDDMNMDMDHDKKGDDHGDHDSMNHDDSGHGDN
jgi:copper(I)-binding protein